MRRKLQRLGYEDAAITPILNALASEGLLSDQRYIEVRLRSRIAQGYGKLRIRQELLSQGLPEDLVDQAFAEDATNWQDLMERARCKRFGKPLPTATVEIARQARFLQYRGFSPRMISRRLQGREENN